VATFLADTSAWHRSGQVAELWDSLLQTDEVAICTPIRLELLYSASSRQDYRDLSDELDGVRSLPIDDRVEAAAERAQRGLAQRSQHRGPTAVDLLVAATAEAHGATLLHYDHHFDSIARVTGQPCEWIARRGSLH
jgi:predicted nucleic acid-binding protein